MLSQFSVKNFKNFNEEIAIDFSAGSYTFNDNAIHNGLVNNAIIYGPNASGKSNFGFAVFDIVRHLTNFQSDKYFYLSYSNASNNDTHVEFEYCFKFNTDTVIYQYIKDENSQLLDESLKINGKQLLAIKRTNNSDDIIIAFSGAKTLIKDIRSFDISIVNYVRHNTAIKNNADYEIFLKFYNFIQGMLFFRSLSSNDYLGLETGQREIFTDIINKNNVKDFQKFLNRAGIVCKLTKEMNDIFFDYGNNRFIPFSSVASSGTKALALVYFWLQRIKNNQVKFLFIDEFDAFYHHQLSEFIVQELKEIDTQVVLTTHNTSIMSNNLLRPDCYYVLDKNKITQINKKTEKELRKAHNLEKLYVGGKFS